MRLYLASGLALLMLASACSDDAKGDGESAETGEPADYGPVRGDLVISSIEVSQSVVQPIYQDGNVVNPAEYGVPIVPNRHMWVRALWDPPLEWTPRPLIARLNLEMPDGTIKVIEDRESASGTPPTVVGKSSPTDLLSGFYWRLDAEDVVPDLRYSITVVEPVPADDIPESTGKTQWPRDSNTSMAVQAAPAVLNLAIIGIRYNANGCVSDTSNLPPDELEALRAGFEAWNGIGSNTVTIDTDISIDIDTPTNVFDLLMVGGMIRAQYADIQNAFFLVLLNDCSPVPNGVLGVAPVNMDPPSMGDSATRYGVGLWIPNDIQESVNTVVHETGHAQGAEHAPCGGAAGPDPNYPHANASIGAWGLDLLTAVYYDPISHTDFMSYCRPYWVSDYRFGKSYNVQSVLTSWGGGDHHELEIAPPPNYSGAVLTGVVQFNGETRWWVNENPLPPVTSLDNELRVELDTPAGARALATSVKDLPDLPGGARLVTVPLVDGIDIEDIRGITVHGAVEARLDAPQIEDARALQYELRRR